MMQDTAAFHHQSAYTLLPQADLVFDDTTTRDTTGDRLDPPRRSVEAQDTTNRD